MCVAAFAFVQCYLPETRGLTLEDVGDAQQPAPPSSHGQHHPWRRIVLDASSNSPALRGGAGAHEGVSKRGVDPVHEPFDTHLVHRL